MHHLFQPLHNIPYVVLLSFCAVAWGDVESEHEAAWWGPGRMVVNLRAITASEVEHQGTSEYEDLLFRRSDMARIGAWGSGAFASHPTPDKGAVSKTYSAGVEGISPIERSTPRYSGRSYQHYLCRGRGGAPVRGYPLVWTRGGRYGLGIGGELDDDTVGKAPYYQTRSGGGALRGSSGDFCGQGYSGENDGGGGLGSGGVRFRERALGVTGAKSATSDSGYGDPYRGRDDWNATYPNGAESGRRSFETTKGAEGAFRGLPPLGQAVCGRRHRRPRLRR